MATTPMTYHAVTVFCVVALLIALAILIEKAALRRSSKPGCTCTLGGGWDPIVLCVVHALPPSPPSRLGDQGPMTFRQHERIEDELSTLHAMCDPFTSETHRALSSLRSSEAEELIRKIAAFNLELAAVLRRGSRK